MKILREAMYPKLLILMSGEGRGDASQGLKQSETFHVVHQFTICLRAIAASPRQGVQGRLASPRTIGEINARVLLGWASVCYLGHL